MAWLAAAFLASGAAALVYQVAWQRILELQSGVGIYSVAAIVSAFMLGLGAGSLGGGAASVRLSPRGALRAFALVELAVGAFGALSPRLYYDLLYVHAPWLYTSLGRAALVHCVVLLPPTFLMGVSLPLLARATVADPHRAGRTLGILYGVNLLGAAAGAALAPMVLIRYFGIRGATLGAAAANLFAAMAGLAAARGASVLDEEPHASVEAAGLPLREADGAEGLAGRWRTWMPLYALSGFVALSLEIVWFRIVDVGVKSNAFTFGAVLFVYLLGCALGCLAAAFTADRVARPLELFLGLQCVLVAYAGAAVVLLGWLPAGLPLLGWFDSYWRGAVSVRFSLNDLPGMLRLYGLLPGGLFGPPTFLMGASFPLLQRAVQDDASTAGRKVGWLQAANIAGCVAGSLLVGLLTLGSIGTTGTLRLLMVAGSAFALIGTRTRSRPPFVAAGLALLLLAAAIPGQGRLWMRLHGRPEEAGMVGEDATSVAALIALPDGERGVFVNGKHHSSIPFGGMHTRLGAAPVIIHPAPRDVAIIGLGSGDTGWSAACRPETASLTVFEISGGQPRLLAKFAAGGGYPVLASFLADPRLHIVIEDGRRALQASDRRFDVIEADALWPRVAYSGNLYSVEFFAMCARRLRPGGVVCTWGPTPRVYASFVSALPYVIGLGDQTLLIGSNEPLAMDRDAWRERLHSPAVRAYLGDAGMESTQWALDRLRPWHRAGRRQPEHDRNRDLFPRDEFVSP